MFEIIKVNALRKRIPTSFAKLEKELVTKYYEKILKPDELKLFCAFISSNFLKREYMRYKDDYYLIQDGEENYVGLFQTRKTEDTVEILKLYIKKEYKNKGLGYKSFLKIIEDAKAKKAKKIVIYINQNFDKAKKSIERWGFKGSELTARYIGSDIYLYENYYEYEL